MVGYRYKKNFYRIELRAVLACANIGFYTLIIDQTNFGLNWKVKLYLKPKVFTGIPISIVKLDLHVLPDMGIRSLSQYLMIVFKLYLSLPVLSKSTSNLTLPLNCAIKTKKQRVFSPSKKKQKTFFFEKMTRFFIIYNTNCYTFE